MELARKGFRESFENIARENDAMLTDQELQDTLQAMTKTRHLHSSYCESMSGLLECTIKTINKMIADVMMKPNNKAIDREELLRLLWNRHFDRRNTPSLVKSATNGFVNYIPGYRDPYPSYHALCPDVLYHSVLPWDQEITTTNKNKQEGGTEKNNNKVLSPPSDLTVEAAYENFMTQAEKRFVSIGHNFSFGDGRGNKFAKGIGLAAEAAIFVKTMGLSLGFLGKSVDISDNQNRDAREFPFVELMMRMKQGDVLDLKKLLDYLTNLKEALDDYILLVGLSLHDAIVSEKTKRESFPDNDQKQIPLKHEDLKYFAFVHRRVAEVSKS